MPGLPHQGGNPMLDLDIEGSNEYLLAKTAIARINHKKFPVKFPVLNESDPGLFFARRRGAEWAKGGHGIAGLARQFSALPTLRAGRWVRLLLQALLTYRPWERSGPARAS
jgi:hypothetical protein